MKSFLDFEVNWKARQFFISNPKREDEFVDYVFLIKKGYEVTEASNVTVEKWQFEIEITLYDKPGWSQIIERSLTKKQQLSLSKCLDEFNIVYRLIE